MPPEVLIKGIREGLLISFGQGDWPDVEQALFEEIDHRVEFLKGAQLILDVEDRLVNAAAMTKLRRRLGDQGLSLWAVLSQSPETERTAQTLGLATRIHEGTAAEGPVRSGDEGEDALFVRRTLRSGATISHPGHVTVIGDVNPGAEIIAGGNVLVWGRLRGLVHAGAEGDEEAVVCALDLSPTQLRIAEHIAIPPEQDGAPRPEMARVRDGQVVAEPWEPAKVAT